jgi:hypothetical protein
MMLVPRRLNQEKVMSHITGYQFGTLGACPVVLGGCPHSTGWWGHPNHGQLRQEVLGTQDPTTARDIRCLHWRGRGAVGETRD